MLVGRGAAQSRPVPHQAYRELEYLPGAGGFFFLRNLNAGADWPPTMVENEKSGARQTGACLLEQKAGG